ncbi:hypothetical protein VMT65_32550 [Nocardia sp. CDC153]|uniref:hypothetical protein n=1 Tax=Nocardia sp. CDC153 TaxID=3112167 RepID=UPI002DBDF803|nr:hypothetical protein [Nocardia sp. CDC153]MEC3957804.1 hypothetical protein [Nocardia sp. CDC153]
MVNDVEKRWNDPSMLRHATQYVLTVLGAAILGGVAVVVWASSRSRCLDSAMMCDATSRVVVGLVPGGILLVGGITALVIAFRAWRDGRAWPIWQGVGWFLFTLMVVYLSIVATQG